MYLCLQVTVDDSLLSHMTRDRVKIPHNRRLPTRGHLLAVVRGVKLWPVAFLWSSDWLYLAPVEG